MKSRETYKESSDSQNSSLIENLIAQRCFKHPVDHIEIIETHISWIILTGLYAYKIKKAINFGYCDCSTLEKRVNYSKEEIRLNRRLAPNLYLGLCAIKLISDRYIIKDLGLSNWNFQTHDCTEVAVKMKQFDSDKLLSNLIDKDKVEMNAIKNLARKLANFHLSKCDKKIPNNHIQMNTTIEPANENINILSKLGLEKLSMRKIKLSKEWIDNKTLFLEEEFNRRMKAGTIRECHGDLHSENIYLEGNISLEAFDAIDFNQKLRWIDPISEIVFLVMDFRVRGVDTLSNALLNTWLEETGDYHGLILYKFYSIYRALVRAKVLGLRYKQVVSKEKNGPSQEKDESKLIENLNKYLHDSKITIKDNNLMLIIMHGLSGSGKSFVSERISYQIGAIRIRSDTERRRAFGLLPIQKDLGMKLSLFNDQMRSPEFKVDRYDQAVTNWLFGEQLPRLAISCLKGGFNTIIDAAFLKEEERSRMSNLADELHVKFVIITCECSIETAKARLQQRKFVRNEPSEADFDIYNSQKIWAEELTQKELSSVIKFHENTTVESVIQQLKRLP